MKVVRIVDKAAGNESVGEMWQETEIFDDSQPISDLFEHSGGRILHNGYIKLSIPQSEIDKWEKEKVKGVLSNL